MGLKALVEKGLDRLPHRFIRPLGERPELLVHAEDGDHDEVHVIDMQRDVHPSSPSPNLLESISRACVEWGCFQVVNHGVCPKKAEHQFFSLPEQEKMKHYTSDTLSKFRYGSSFNLKKDEVLNWRDFIRYSCHPLNDVFPLWPCNPPAFRKASADFCIEMHGLVKLICGAISQSLGFTEEYIERVFNQYSQTIVCNYYPKCPNPASTLGVVNHTDPGWITVLMQDYVGGLQVFYRDRWIPVKPIPNALVVNHGDVMQILSNGRYKSAEHRAIVNTSRDRLSVLTTYGPSLDSMFGPAHELLGDASGAVYR